MPDADDMMRALQSAGLVERIVTPAATGAPEGPQRRSGLLTAASSAPGDRVDLYEVEVTTWDDPAHDAVRDHFATGSLDDPAILFFLVGAGWSLSARRRAPDADVPHDLLDRIRALRPDGVVIFRRDAPAAVRVSRPAPAPVRVSRPAPALSDAPLTQNADNGIPGPTRAPAPADERRRARAEERARRDAEIVRLYADGRTLEDIGDLFGVTRERIRQVVKKHGGVDAEASRARRAAVKAAEREAQRAAFLAAHGELARDLARRGVTRPETVDRIRALFPEVDAALAEEALRLSGIVFDKSPVENVFSEAELEAGVWFLLGSEHGTRPDRAWAAQHLAPELIAAVREALADTAVTEDDLATIIGVIGAAMRHVRENPDATITGARYEELRGELVAALGLVSAKGRMPWPPTRQTLMKRFGGWNEALSAFGIATSKRGRAKGLVVFELSDYVDALREFCTLAAERGEKPTYDRYERWVAGELERGVRRPSGASIRNVYGTWLDAVRSVD